MSVGLILWENVGALYSVSDKIIENVNVDEESVSDIEPTLRLSRSINLRLGVVHFLSMWVLISRHSHNASRYWSISDSSAILVLDHSDQEEFA